MKNIRKLHGRLSIRYYKELKSSISIGLGLALFFFLLSVPAVFGQDETAQNESEVNDLTRYVIATTTDGKTFVYIKTTFPMNTTSKGEMINEIINNFSLTREDVETILQSETIETEFEEKFEVIINSKQCISQITTDVAFILDTSDKDKILDEIVKRSHLTSKQINKVLEFDIDQVELTTTVRSGKARVQLDYCDTRERFVINSSDEAEIISEISSRTGLREYKIPLIWKFSTDVVKEIERVPTAEEIKQMSEGIISTAQNQMQKAEQTQQAAIEGTQLETGGTGGCLIATATYGTELSPQIQILREIRDNSVLVTQSGTAFMSVFNSFYYSFSPTIADLERQNPMFRQIVKVAITPLLSSLSLLQYVDIDSEAEMIGYGIGIILLNIGMYFVAPALIIFKLKNRK